jgi:hypothetical protein
MKKIALVMFISSAFVIISCSGDGGDDTETGYVDPGSWSGKTINSNKMYSFTNGTISESCGPNAECNAIIYQNTLNDTNYVGVAVNDKHLGAASNFSLKIYWVADTIGSVNLAPANYTIKVVKGANEYSTTANYLDITVNDQGDGSYTVDFNNPITIDAVTINNTDSITAVKYP